MTLQSMKRKKDSFLYTLRYVVTVFMNNTKCKILLARMHKNLECWVRMLKKTS